MSLAKGLNDLAAAHTQNLISDDDYRILRKELFERYSVEPQSQAPKPRVVQVHQQQPRTPPPPLHRKPSVVAGVANLFRRARGRSAKKHSESLQITIPPAEVVSPTASSSPRRIVRKPSLLSIKRSDQPPTPAQVSSPTQEDDAAILRRQISCTEAEHTRLLEAFSSLESSTLKRIQYKTARRLYTPTPADVSVLIEGREWRKHTKPVPSIVLPPLSHHTSQPLSKYHLHRIHHNPPHTTPPSTHTSDELSIHSAASSSKLSLVRSFSSLAPPNSRQPHSPLSPHFRPSTNPHMLQRHDSVSSASSQSTSTHASSRRLALTTAPRSVGNLYLASLAERSGSSADTVADYRVLEEDEDVDDIDLENDDPEAADYETAFRELNDIRRRREELNIRFASKLEYLKARLKAAEIHERVMRR